MSFGKVANCLLIIFIALANGTPQNEASPPQDTADPLPFIQFTNGGVRLNFAGYHAQAGLGGLLGGSGTGGGLHASAGTPWGAHAGAGLGGQLSGEDSSLGGGLYARAGLGRGRPEAAAGLGGSLDGSGRSSNPILGGMYAGATTGGGPGTGVFLGNGITKVFDGFVSGSSEAGASASGSSIGGQASANADTNASASVSKPAKGHTNIQIIRSKAKDSQKEKEVALEAAALPADAPAGGKAVSKNNEVRRAVQYGIVPAAAGVGLTGSLFVGAAPAVKTVEKTVVASAPVAVVPVPVPVPVPVQRTVQANVKTNVGTVTTVDINPSVIVSKPVYPRWYFRKRFWNVPRKVVYVAPTVTTDIQSASSKIVGGGLYANVIGDGGVVATKTYASGSLFDDIFNIPISTLSAVNQLLNNVG